jgi:dihydrofolate reductase
LGRDGERLQEWMFAGRTSAESQHFETDHFEGIGALILGRCMADLGIGPPGDEPTFHAPASSSPHRPAQRSSKQGGTSYIFVPDGIENALLRAQEAADSQDLPARQT